MSFTIIEQATPRLHRSELAVPGSNPGMFEKAARCAADIVFLDLEDAVAPDDKEQARRNIIQALNEIEWGSKTMMIRINGLDIGWTDTEGEDLVQRRFHDAGDDWRERAAEDLPMGKLAQVDEIADFVVFLLSPRSGVVTGSVIDWDQQVIGGMG